MNQEPILKRIAAFALAAAASILPPESNASFLGDEISIDLSLTTFLTGTVSIGATPTVRQDTFLEFTIAGITYTFDYREDVFTVNGSFFGFDLVILFDDLDWSGPNGETSFFAYISDPTDTGNTQIDLVSTPTSVLLSVYSINGSVAPFSEVTISFASVPIPLGAAQLAALPIALLMLFTRKRSYDESDNRYIAGRFAFETSTIYSSDR